jgi:hypothetical protein
LEESALSSRELSKKPIRLMSSLQALTLPGHSTLCSPRNSWFANWPAQAGVIVIKRRNSIDGQFAPHTIEMIKSPAWSVLSLSARRVLDRIEIEHADHGGNDNGRLPVTYDDFECYGIHRHSIRAAIRETVALGFAEITERGRAGNAEFRSSHKFRLTYFHVGRAPPTNEWQRIKTVEEAQALAKAARREARQITKVQCRKMPNLSGGNRHRKRQFNSAETTTTRLSADSTTTIYILGGKASQADRRCSAFIAMSEYLSGLAPELARGLAA